MKLLLSCLLIFIGISAFGQSILPFRGDTIMIHKVGGSAELVLINKTKDTLGFLFNYGLGRTKFSRMRQLNDSMIIAGIDTFIIRGSGIASVTTKNPITKIGDSVSINYNPSSLSIKQNTLVTKVPVFNSFDEMRAIPEDDLDSSFIYNLHRPGDVWPWKYDPSDEDSDDDSAMVIVTPDGKRLKRELQGVIYVDWWIREDDVDASAGFQRMFDWIEAAANRSYRIEAQKRHYRINTQVNWPGALPTGNAQQLFLEMNMPGVVIETDSAITTFYRFPANGTEATAMIGSYKPIIRGIYFKGPLLSGSVALRFGATYGMVIENNFFESYDTAIVSKFSLKGVIRNNFFTTNMKVAILGASGEEWGQTVASSSFNANVIDNNRIFNGSGSFAGIMLWGADGTMITNHISEGHRPSYHFYLDYQASTVVNQNTFDNIWLESAGAGASVCFYLRTGGTTTISRVQQTTPTDTLFHIPSNAASNAIYIFEKIPYMVTSAIYNADGLAWSGAYFRFYDVSSLTTSYLTNTANWVGGVVPSNLLITGIGSGGGNNYTSNTIIRLQPSYNTAAANRLVEFRGGISFIDDNTYYIGGVASNLRPFRISIGTGGMRVAKTSSEGYGFGDPTVTPVQKWININDSVTQIVSTGAIRMPTGTTAQRPTFVASNFRYNSTLGRYEYANGSAWLPIADTGWVRTNFIPNTVGASSTETDSAAVIDRTTNQLVMRPIATGGGGGTSTWDYDYFATDGSRAISATAFLKNIVVRAFADVAELKIGTTAGGSEIWSGALVDEVDKPLDIGLWIPTSTTIYITGLTAASTDAYIWFNIDSSIPTPPAP